MTGQNPPPTLASFRNAHRGGSIVVCGCGVSLDDLTRPDEVVTIGVNDVGRRFHPDYLVVVNPPEQFSGDRFRWVAGSQARYLFTQLDLPVPHPEVVKFQLGAYGGTDCWSDDVLHYTRNSPYVALCLAAYMGADRIGLIGVDFTDDHFFGRTGCHPLAAFLPAIDEEYRRLGAALKAHGVTVYNLSGKSRLTAFPRMSVEDFSGRETARARPTGLRMVSYATTPLVGVPAILARCITARTPHTCRCVWAQAGYGNGVTFDGDIEWTVSPAEADAALSDADLVIVHNGKVEPDHRALLKNKAVVTVAHNYGWNVDTTLVEDGAPGLVVGQYQATLPEFAGWSVVPNPIPLWEEAFQPDDKGSIVGICYTPSGRHERYPGDHRLYWHSKGYDTTMRALDDLARRFTIRVEALREGQVSHARALAMKRGSHVVIDECVTGSYHRNSLEGLAAGCVVLNAMGSVPGIVAALDRCTMGAAPMPFVRASLAELRDVLAVLTCRGPEALVADGLRNREWMETHWDFGRQWERFWMPAVEAALHRRHGRGPVTPGRVTRIGTSQAGVFETDGEHAQVAGRPAGSVSVVVPHGGAERLPHLGATLANLGQCEGVREVIVAEMGAAPVAAELARRWGARYVFVPSPGIFERARALNVGSAIASGDLILWKDNDLLMGTDFVARAAAEVGDRGLDYLIPYCSIAYLSETDTRVVLEGALDPAAARPVKTLFSGRDVSGGAGLARKDFVIRYGGMPEGFRGWGGEDNAWLHKVMLMGQWGVTQRREQHLVHLFHSGSGAHRGRPPGEDPGYARNLSLLQEIKAIRTREQFLERFPPGPGSCPWPRERRIALVTSGATPPDLVRRAAGVERAFRRLFDVRLETRCLEGDDAHAPHDAGACIPDAAVVMGRMTATSWLSTRAGEARKRRAVVVLEADAAPSAADWHGLEETAAILAPPLPNPTEPHGPRDRWWRCPPETDGDLALAVALVQPLSLALGAGDEASVRLLETPVTVPVWMYWEGDCPEWIARCEETVRAHAPHVRRLGWAEFDRLWDRDRDIDILQLAIPHRADFIRAFLLARFGGLWIDADCVVMQSLEPTLRCLETVDFVGHRDRQGFVPNGFIGARPGSVIAEALYRRVCDTLRARRQIGWISLGGEPLTEIIRTTAAPWRELPCEAIQPICWSQPGAFFETGTPDEHERRFSESALCYMLSNSEIKKFQAANPARDLLAPGTFFCHVVGRSLGTSAPAPGAVTVRPAPTFRHLPFYLDAVVELSPRRMLEIGMGRGHWGALIRELTDDSAGSGHGPVWIDAIEDAEGLHAESLTSLYDRIVPADAGEVLDQTAERWDLSVFTRPLGHFTRDCAEHLLRRALAVSDYVLVTSTLADAPRDNGRDRRDPGQKPWALHDFLALDPVRAMVDEPPTGIATGAFLMSERDPRGLRKPSSMSGVFRNIFLRNRQASGESLSGPGSGLVQTAEIRRRLPFVLQHLGVKILLDAPCGDFYWMRTLALGIDEYIGVDVVDELVALNRERYGRPGRWFLQLDLASDPLPRADLILCRDCLGHFAHRDVFRALANFRRSRSRYLMATTFPTVRTNAEAATGDWRPLNLERPPFNLPPPLVLVNEQCTEAQGRYADKSLGVWRLGDLQL